jgi:hypothetical protein
VYFVWYVVLVVMMATDGNFSIKNKHTNKHQLVIPILFYCISSSWLIRSQGITSDHLIQIFVSLIFFGNTALVWCDELWNDVVVYFGLIQNRLTLTVLDILFSPACVVRMLLDYHIILNTQTGTLEYLYLMYVRWQPTTTYIWSHG